MPRSRSSDAAWLVIIAMMPSHSACPSTIASSSRCACVDDGVGSGDDGARSGDDGAGSGDDGAGSGDDGAGSGDDGAGSGDAAGDDDSARGVTGAPSRKARSQLMSHCTPDKCARVRIIVAYIQL